MKFSNKLSLAIFLTGFFSLTIISLAIYWLNYSNFLKSQLEQTSSLARAIADDIERGLYEKVNTALTLANSPIIKKGLKSSNLSYAHLPPDARDKSIEQLNEKWKLITTPSDRFIQEFTHNKIAHFLKSQQTTLKGEYGEIFLTNKFGALVASTSKLSTFAHGHKYWWQSSYDNGEGAVFLDDRGYDDSVGGYVLGLVIPVRKDSEIIGILKCNLNIIGGINELLINEEHKRLGQFKLTRSGGMIVFEEGFKPLSTRMPKSIVQKMDVKDSTPFLLDDSGVKYLIGLSELEPTKNKKRYGFGGTFESIDHKMGNYGESWYLICYRETDEALSSLGNTIKWALLVGSLLVIILIVTAQFFSRKISQPLSALNDATKKIGDGNFDLDINIKQKDEFGRLADAFKKMALDLKDTTTSIVFLENEVDKRKKAERELSLQKQKAESYLNIAGVIFIGLNRSGEICLANKKACEVLECEVDALIGLNWFDSFVLEKNRKEVRVVFQQLMNGQIESVESYENGIITKTNKEKIIAWHNSYITNEYGEITEIVSAGEDITDKRLMEKQLQQVQKIESIGNLAGGIAHDFNNILFPIIGMSELLIEDLPKDSPEYGNAHEILTAGKRGGELVKQILAFSRQSEHRLIPVRIQQVLKEVMKLIRSTIPSNIKITQNIQQDCGLVLADQTQIHQIAMNLITNAYHAVESNNGNIKIQLTETRLNHPLLKRMQLRAGNYAVLTVSDTGCGIKPEVLEVIFEPYFTTKKQGKGTGLGLAVVHGIVKEYGGDIHVISEPGKGSVFEVYIPLMKKKADSQANKDIIEAPTGAEKILVVDDEHSVAKIESLILQRLGYKVTISTSSIEAYALFEKNPEKFDLVITDMTMPNLTGDILAEKILTIRPDMPIIVCTGFSEKIDKDYSKLIGVKGILMKPIEKEAMARMVRKVLDEGTAA